MRKSRIEAAKTRERIVTAAAAEFRQHGIAGTGLADLMKAAGLTHGGFYRHFKSKDHLVAEACSAAVATMTERVAASASGKRGRKSLETAVADYLSTEHRDNPRDGCPLAALGSEMARADTQTRAGILPPQARKRSSSGMRAVSRNSRPSTDSPAGSGAWPLVLGATAWRRPAVTRAKVKSRFGMQASGTRQ